MDLGSLQDLIGRDKETITWWQMTIRGLLVFLFGLALVRLADKRTFGKSDPLDIILAVMIGSNLSRTLTANAPMLPTFAASAAVVAAHALIARVAVHWRFLSWLVKGQEAYLVRNGEIDWAAMRRHNISKGDLEEAVRSAKLRGLDQVDLAVLERAGTISVIRKEG